MKNILTKSAGLLSKELAPVFDIKAIDEQTGAFSGYGSVFDVIDSYGEVVVAGAFKKSLATSKKAKFVPKMFWQHWSDQPIGRWTNLFEDDKGLVCEGVLNLKTQRGAEAHAHLMAEDIDGLSIGYREVKVEEPEDAETPRKLLQLNLLEVSVVSLGANGQARVSDVKSQQLATSLQEFAAALRDGEPRPIKEFEDLLREAGIPKSMAVSIASVGYAKAIRSDSGGEEAEAAASQMLESIRSLLSQ